MNENPVTERFLIFLNYLISEKLVVDAKDFTKKIGVGTSAITEIKKGRTGVGAKLIQNSVLKFKLNANWLAGEKGEMISENVEDNENTDQISTNSEKDEDMTEKLNLYRENNKLLKENSNFQKRITELENELLMYKGKSETGS